MKPRRIAYVLNIFPKISETFIAGELAELRGRGVELRILSLLPPRDEPRHEIIRRAELDHLIEYDIGRFRESLSRCKPDLLHAHFAKEATEQARQFSSEMAIPFTFTAHGYDIHRKPPSDFKERAGAAKAVITVSHANALHIHNTFRVPRSHVHVIPCGVNTNIFQPSESVVRSQTPLILCVARHVAVKNLSLLLKSCTLLKGRGVNFRCVLIGDGPLREDLENQRLHDGLERYVDLRGAANQTEVLRWWQRADIGVLTSDNEGMPVSLMEAAACGVPVVATRVGGIPELVLEGVTGLLSPAGDANAFADALQQLLLDAEMRRRLGVAARQRAEQEFSVARQVDCLLALWTRILNGGGK
jgi:colanic acid/amylovoran biosynthesis glycosyltransferase